MIDPADTGKDGRRYGIRAAMKDVYRDKCQYCLERPGEHIDHIVPRARGGSDDLTNLILACASCNGRKGAGEIPETYLALILAIAARNKPAIERHSSEPPTHTKLTIHDPLRGITDSFILPKQWRKATIADMDEYDRFRDWTRHQREWDDTFIQQWKLHRNQTPNMSELRTNRSNVSG